VVLIISGIPGRRNFTYRLLDINHHRPRSYWAQIAHYAFEIEVLVRYHETSLHQWCVADPRGFFACFGMVWAGPFLCLVCASAEVPRSLHYSRACGAHTVLLFPGLASRHTGAANPAALSYWLKGFRLRSGSPSGQGSSGVGRSFPPPPRQQLAWGQPSSLFLQLTQPRSESGMSLLTENS
jgi:hypothetical protein